MIKEQEVYTEYHSEREKEEPFEMGLKKWQF